MYSIYKVINPTKDHKFLEGCLGQSTGLFRSVTDLITGDDPYTICLKFRVSKFINDAFISFDLDLSEVKLIKKDGDPEFWTSDNYVYDYLVDYAYRYISI